VRAFADAGCRYLQLDEVNLAYLCDPEQRRILRQRGDDPDRLPGLYAGLINSAIGGRPADMTITMHLCRGNFRSSWIAQGGYEPVADMLFNQIGVEVCSLMAFWLTPSRPPCSRWPHMCTPPACGQPAWRTQPRSAAPALS
jgi:methionine synthase II (cobalamin-independent)